MGRRKRKVNNRQEYKRGQYNRTLVYHQCLNPLLPKITMVNISNGGQDELASIFEAAAKIRIVSN